MLKLNSFIIAIFLFSSAQSQTCDSTSNKRASFGFNVGLNQSTLYNSNNTEELK